MVWATPILRARTAIASPAKAADGRRKWEGARHPRVLLGYAMKPANFRWRPSRICWRATNLMCNRKLHQNVETFRKLSERRKANNTPAEKRACAKFVARWRDAHSGSNCRRINDRQSIVTDSNRTTTSPTAAPGRHALSDRRAHPPRTPGAIRPASNGIW